MFDPAPPCPLPGPSKATKFPEILPADVTLNFNKKITSVRLYFALH